MNIFQPKKRSSFSSRGILGPITGFLIMSVFFLYGLNLVSLNTQTEQKQILENALNRVILHYYSLEGRYPSSLKEIESRYPLAYDREKYIIYYQPIGENMMPDLTILVK